MVFTVANLWRLEEHFVVHLLFTHTDLTDQQVGNIYNNIFPAQKKSANWIRDDWTQRSKPF